MNARCFTSPPNVIDDAPTFAASPLASSPPTYHANVAR
jgi:hypothetical protein